MKLYYSKGACSLAVRIVIHELELPCEFEAVNLSTKQTETGHDFMTVTAKGSVPTLVLDSGEVLTENSVIQEYLAEKYDTQHQLLADTGDFKRYRTLEWLNYVSTELHKGFSPFFNTKLSAEIKNTVFAPAFKAKLDFVDKHLATNQYLTGDTLNLADGYLYVILTWIRHQQWNVHDWANLSRYVRELQLRPAIIRSLQEEGLRPL
jgi:glutathione S-transferase